MGKEAKADQFGSFRGTARDRANLNELLRRRGLAGVRGGYTKLLSALLSEAVQEQPGLDVDEEQLLISYREIRNLSPDTARLLYVMVPRAAVEQPLLAHMLAAAVHAHEQRLGLADARPIVREPQETGKGKKRARERER